MLSQWFIVDDGILVKLKSNSKQMSLTLYMSSYISFFTWKLIVSQTQDKLKKTHEFDGVRRLYQWFLVEDGILVTQVKLKELS